MCAGTGTKAKKARPPRPQTNGAVDHFHRILLEEWGCIRPWMSDAERTTGYAGFLHFCNDHRSHGALGWATPIETLNRLHGDSLPAEHI